MKTVLILDTETTGLEPKRDSLIELGMVLYSVEHLTTLVQLSFLLPVGDNPAEKINKIPEIAARKMTSFNTQQAIDFAITMINYSDAIIAHNAAFDKQWMAHIGLNINTDKKPWICTLDDVAWPDFPNGTTLVTLALHYGIGVFNPHRALTDCQLLAAIFDREPNLASLLEKALIPKKIYYAPCAYEDIKKRELISAFGFKWARIVPKKWAKKCTEEEAKSMPFEIIEVFNQGGLI
jgi:DNA polymerase-3 subunit epsilon